MRILLLPTVGIVMLLGLCIGKARAQESTSTPEQATGNYEANAPAVETSAPAEEGKPWKLPQPQFLKEHKIDMGGWIQQGITYDAWDPTDKFNGPLTTNDRSDEYQLNQAWLYFVRPTKTDGCGFDIGGRIDLVYGTDWRFGQSFGLENHIDDPNSFYGLVLPQFYGEIAINDLTVKFGHFATLTSLEIVPAPLNFFYSHSYIGAGYYDPLLVTGVQFEYKLNDNWTAIGGVNDGWLAFEDPGSGYDFLGGAKWASDDKKSSLSMMVISGPTATFTGYHDVDNVIMVYTHQFNECWWSGTQLTFGREAQGSAINPGQDDQWYGFEEELTYKINCKWSAGGRYEWIQDNQGSRIGGVGLILGTGRAWDGLPGFVGPMSDLTLGLNYRPNKNWVIRPEMRWDWYGGGPNPAGQLPFNSFGSSSQFTAACDAVVTF